MPPRGLIIAGTHSGCGKTSVALGVMAALSARGCAVQPFKVGPDFIDPGHHRRVTGRESHNLDGWMLRAGVNRAILRRYAADADLVVVEGVMGLFDGFSGTHEAGSTAQMAKWLGLPVLLVVDARSMARSAAALVQGYSGFDPELSLLGVVFNRVGSSGHRDILEEALRSAGAPPSFGALVRRPDLEIPSRHLGLVTEEDWGWGAGFVQTLVEWIEEGLDLDGLLRAITAGPPGGQGSEPETDSPQPLRGKVRIGLARDAAFCFYYAENLRLLREAGAELAPFSPVSDASLPRGLQGLYLGGGYPELHGQHLAANRSMLESIRRFCASGRPVYAECGGYMYLMRSLRDLEGQRHSLAGIFPFDAVMEDRFRALGYREVATTRESLLGPAGTKARGHEFHYSRIETPAQSLPAVYELSDRKGGTRPAGALFGNVLGSYIHLHWGSNSEAAAAFVRACTAHDPL